MIKSAYLIILAILFTAPLIADETNKIVTSSTEVNEGVKVLQDKLFNKLFPLLNNERVKYNVTIEMPPNDQMAKIFEKNIKENPSTQIESNNNILFDKLCKDYKSGHVSIRELTFTTSTNNLILDDVTKISPVQSINVETFFCYNSTIVKYETGKRIEVLPSGSNKYPEIPAFFPKILKPINLDLNILKCEHDDKANIYTLAYSVRGYPYLYTFSIDIGKSMINSLVCNVKGIIVRKSILMFDNINVNGVLWPKKISSEVYSEDGKKLLNKEIWDIIDKPSREENVIYTPQITSDYTIEDKTGLKIPNSEINKLLDR